MTAKPMGIFLRFDILLLFFCSNNSFPVHTSAFSATITDFSLCNFVRVVTSQASIFSLIHFFSYCFYSKIMYSLSRPSITYPELAKPQFFSNMNYSFSSSFLFLFFVYCCSYSRERKGPLEPKLLKPANGGARALGEEKSIGRRPTT